MPQGGETATVQVTCSLDPGNGHRNVGEIQPFRLKLSTEITLA